MKRVEPEGDQPLGTCDTEFATNWGESRKHLEGYGHQEIPGVCKNWRPVSAPVPQKCPTCGSAKVEIKRLVSDETCCEYGGPTLWDPCEDAWHDNSAAPSPTRGACKANIYHESVGHTPDITCVDWVAAPVPEPARTLKDLDRCPKCMSADIGPTNRGCSYKYSCHQCRYNFMEPEKLSDAGKIPSADHRAMVRALELYYAQKDGCPNGHNPNCGKICVDCVALELSVFSGSQAAQLVIYELELAKLREQIDGARRILEPKGSEGA